MHASHFRANALKLSGSTWFDTAPEGYVRLNRPYPRYSLSFQTSYASIVYIWGKRNTCLITGSINWRVGWCKANSHRTVFWRLCHTEPKRDYRTMFYVELWLTDIQTLGKQWMTTWEERETDTISTRVVKISLRTTYKIYALGNIEGEAGPCLVESGAGDVLRWGIHSYLMLSCRGEKAFDKPLRLCCKVRVALQCLSP